MYIVNTIIERQNHSKLFISFVQLLASNFLCSPDSVVLDNTVSTNLPIPSNTCKLLVLREEEKKGGRRKEREGGRGSTL